MFLVIAVLCAALATCDQTVNVFRNLQTFETSHRADVQTGSLDWPLPLTNPHRSSFFVARRMVDTNRSSKVIRMLKQEPFQEDLDSVDQAATYQFWLEAHNRRLTASASRDRVQAILRPILDERVVPLVNELYPGQSLQPCFSFVRRYNPLERVKHPTHFDVHAFATFVVSLNNFEDDYRGGLYVTTGDREIDRHYINLAAGDAAIHQSDLLHGVRLFSGERWSWVVWFRPESCGSNALKWHAEKAEQGDPIYQFLLARRHLDLDEGLTDARHSTDLGMQWLRKAAENGFPRAQNELGEYIRTNTDDRETARRWFMKAIENGDVNAIHNLGLWQLDGDAEMEAFSLFQKACKAECSDACFNVAIAHHKGKAGVVRNDDAAAKILRLMDTPDALFYAFGFTENNADLQRAVALGSSDAQYEAGKRMAATKNVRDALAMFRKAARNGHQKAREALHAIRLKDEL